MSDSNVSRSKSNSSSRSKIISSPRSKSFSLSSFKSNSLSRSKSRSNSSFKSSSKTSSNSRSNSSKNKTEVVITNRSIKKFTDTENLYSGLFNKYNAYDPLCVRQKTNFGASPNSGEFNLIDTKPSRFNDKLTLDVIKKNVLEYYPSFSPKMVDLLDNIKKLDESDEKKYGKKFKHFIFTDIRSNQYGARMIGSILLANDFTLGYSSDINEGKLKYEKIKLKSDDELKETKYENFYILNTAGLYDQPFTRIMKKNILDKFNSRPDNIHGELIRFIVMDSGYKEGIDLFDIKYVHIFEPQQTLADLKQVIGRGTRLCGQKGLNFDAKKGWPLDVFIYDLKIEENVKPLFLNSNTAFELYLKTLNYDISLYNFQIALQEFVAETAVDSKLNANINKYSNEAVDEQIEEINTQTGGNVEDVGKLSTKLTYDNLEKIIQSSFQKYKWDKIKIENLCVEKPSEKNEKKNEMTYTNTQLFIRDYFKPEIYQRGMLLWHSVGTGKTCTAILCASSNFERENYTILWVTRTTLVNDIWKNMFSLVCNKNIKDMQDAGLTIPNDLKSQKQLLSKSWKIQPLSYKQFTNLVSKKNNFYKMLTKINGTVDPLRKTLIIIDEAHKLYGESDLLALERPNMEMLHSALMNSYEVSGKDSAKLLLMTATPITKDPMELIKLINLCRPINEQFPDNFYSFKEKYLNEDGLFDRKEQFMNDIAGYVSYLDRSYDIRQFSQPKIHYVYSKFAEKYIDLPINLPFQKEILNLQKQNITKLQHEMNRTNKSYKIEFAKTKKLFQKSKIDLKKLKKEKLNIPFENKKVKTIVNKTLRNIIDNKIKEFNEDNKLAIETMKKNNIEKMKKITDLRKAYRSNSLIVQDTLKENKEKNIKLYDPTFNVSPYNVITKKCGYKEMNANLDKFFNQDKSIRKYNDEIMGLEAEKGQNTKLTNDEIKSIRKKIILIKKQFNIKKNQTHPDIDKLNDEKENIEEQTKGINKDILNKIKYLNKKTRKRKRFIRHNLKNQIRDYKKQSLKSVKEALSELKKTKKEDLEYTDKFVDKFNKLNDEIDKEAEIIINKGISEVENIEAKKMEEKNRKLREKEEEKNRKLREKEEAKTRKLREKEEEKTRKLREKEQAKTRKLIEKKVPQKTRKNRS
jgi:hypothetical protein